MLSSHEVYKQIGVDTEVLSASSHRLIQLLYEKCLQQIQEASRHIQAKDINKKYKAISKSMDILQYLQFCLNKNDKSTHDLTELLDSLYSFLGKHLLASSIKNDVNGLNQAYQVLSSIKSGWDGIGEQETNK